MITDRCQHLQPSFCITHVILYIVLFVGRCEVCPYDETLYFTSRTENSSSSEMNVALNAVFILFWYNSTTGLQPFPTFSVKKKLSCYIIDKHFRVID